jgi:hypothetical protein
MADLENHESSHTANPEAPAGVWPAQTPRWQLAVTALLWVGWIGFLIWMMSLRS